MTLTTRTDSKTEALQDKREYWIWLGLVLLHLIPVWAFAYYPSQDGPEILENARILITYGGQPSLQSYYLINPAFTTNWTLHSIAAVLLMFLAPAAVEKLLVSVLIVLMASALRYTITAINRNAAFISWLAIPLVDNQFMHFGFYSFCYGLAFSILFLGFWLKHGGSSAIGKRLALCGLGLATFAFHPSCFTVMAALVLILLSARAIAARTGALASPQGSEGFVLRNYAVNSLLALAVPAMLMALFLHQQGTRAIAAHSALGLIAYLGGVWLVSFNKFELAVGLTFSAVILAVLLCLLLKKVMSRQFIYADTFALMTALCLIACLAAPQGVAGGTYINERLALYVVLCSTLWIASNSFDRLGKTLICCLSSALVIALVVCQMIAYRQANDYLAEFMTAGKDIAPGSTFLPLYLWQRRSPDGLEISLAPSVILHAGGYIAAEKNAVCLANAEADTNYFPVRYRDDLNPYGLLGSQSESPFRWSTLESEPPAIDLAAYKSHGARVDYIIVWGGQPLLNGTPAGKEILRQLQDQYELAKVSPNRHLMSLYRLRSLQPNHN